MSTSVKFPELSDILIATGLTINGLSKVTGVSRNTLKKMVDGELVSASVVSKLLVSLDQQQSIDIIDYRTALQRKVAQRNSSSQKQENTALLRTVGGADLNFPAHRTTKSITSDLKAKLKLCSDLANELVEALEDDQDVAADDPENIRRNHIKLNADLEFIFLKFGIEPN